VGVVGDGKVGRALERNLSKAGFEVLVGTRKPSQPTYEDAAKFGDIVFLCVPGDVVVQVAKRLETFLLDKKAVIDVVRVYF